MARPPVDTKTYTEHTQRKAAAAPPSNRLEPLAVETSKQLAEACPTAGVKRQLLTGNISLSSSSASVPNEAIR
jgi:hypothetical protein